MGNVLSIDVNKEALVIFIREKRIEERRGEERRGLIGRHVMTFCLIS